MRWPSPGCWKALFRPPLSLHSPHPTAPLSEPSVTGSAFHSRSSQLPLPSSPSETSRAFGPFKSFQFRFRIVLLFLPPPTPAPGKSVSRFKCKFPGKILLNTPPPRTHHPRYQLPGDSGLLTDNVLFAHLFHKHCVS